MLKIQKFVRLEDETFMVGFMDEDSHNAILTLRLTKENIIEMERQIWQQAP